MNCVFIINLVVIFYVNSILRFNVCKKREDLTNTKMFCNQTQIHKCWHVVQVHHQKFNRQNTLKMRVDLLTDHMRI